MKNSKNKIITCIAAAALLFASSQKSVAQKGEIGIRFMPTFSSFDTKNSAGGTVKGTLTIGWGFGALLGYNFTEHIGVQAEVLYTSISQKNTEKDVTREVNLRYVNIPLLLSLNTNKSKSFNLNAVVGPQIGLSAGSSLKTSGGDGSTNADAVLAVKAGDIGFAYGAGLDFAMNEAKTFRFGIGFRGVYGLLDISNDNKTKTTNGYYVLDRSTVKTYSGYAGVSFIF